MHAGQWAGEVSLTGSHFATMRDSSPVSRYLYIDLCFYTVNLAGYLGACCKFHILMYIKRYVSCITPAETRCWLLCKFLSECSILYNSLWKQHKTQSYLSPKVHVYFVSLRKTEKWNLKKSKVTTHLVFDKQTTFLFNPRQHLKLKLSVFLRFWLAIW